MKNRLSLYIYFFVCGKQCSRDNDFVHREGGRGYLYIQITIPTTTTTTKTLPPFFQKTIQKQIKEIRYQTTTTTATTNTC